MKNDIKKRIARIVDGKLSDDEMEELIGFFKIALADSPERDDEDFFRNLAHEMTGSVKEMAMLLIDFRRSLKSKIQPDIVELTEKHIPHAADNLESVIETTELAANKTMDNLDAMQEHSGNIETLFTALRKGEIRVPGTENGGSKIDPKTLRTLSPLMDYVELTIENYDKLISDTFTQMSFQDLTGQRIKHTMGLVRQMEETLKRMVVSFGFKLTEREKHPDISKEELQRVVAAKETELAGPQSGGQGLDQAGIDDLLAEL